MCEEAYKGVSFFFALIISNNIIDKKKCGESRMKKLTSDLNLYACVGERVRKRGDIAIAHLLLPVKGILQL